MTLHEIVTETEHVPCVCGANPDQPCTQAPDGVHWSRIYRAYQNGLIDRADWVSTLSDGIAEGATTYVLDLEEAAG